MTELLPCPFCGGETEWWQQFGWDRKPLGYVAGCCFCGIQTWICDTKEQATETWNKRAAYEAEGYFFLPKPKEQLFYITPLGVKETENGYAAQTGYTIMEEAVKRWANEIDNEILHRIIECFNASAERTCQRVNKPDQFFADNLEYSVDAYRCSVCNFRLDRITNYCPNCGAKVVVEE